MSTIVEGRYELWRALVTKPPVMSTRVRVEPRNRATVTSPDASYDDRQP